MKDGAMPVLPGLPPFAPVSARLLEMLSREDDVVEEVAELLRLDAAVVAEVLRSANAPVFGFERQIRGVASAVARLGTSRLQALVATAALRQSGEGRAGLRGYWRHSVASAFVAAETAPSCEIDPDEAHTAALPDEMRTWEPAGLADSEWSGPVDSPSAPSLAALVADACRTSEALGFAVLPGAGTECSPEAVFEALPQPARERLYADPAALARALEEKIAVINN